MTMFRYRNRFKPPVDDTAWVRLVAHDYTAFNGSTVPFFELIEHFNASVYRGHICSKIWKENEEGELEGTGKCISCKKLDDGAGKDTSFRHLTAFLLLHLDWYYKIPATNEDGETLTYSKDSKYHKAGDTIFDRVHEEAAFEEYLSEYAQISFAQHP